MKSPTRLGFIVPVLLLAGCQYDPHTHRYATTEPTREHIVGDWRATAARLERLHLHPTSPPTLVVGEDSSIIMKNVPTGWRDASHDVGTRGEDFAGRWTLARHQDTWWGLSLRRGDWGCSGCLMVMHNKAPHLLLLRYGDPDEGLGLEFERAAGSGSGTAETRKDGGSHGSRC